jgi:RNA polymerase primary sigma factor
MDKEVRKDGHYSDPAWTYLNSLNRVPLMHRGQEVQHAILIHFARYKLLEMAFREPYILNSIYHLGDQLKNKLIEPVDVLRIEEDQVKDPVQIEEMCETFYVNVNEIKIMDEEVGGFRSVVGESTENEFLEKIAGLEDKYIEKCMQLRLNTRRIKDILDIYKTYLQNNKLELLLENFSYWEGMREQAKCSIIEANVRLAVSIAKRYVHKGMEISDLIQEGNKGLITAVDNFDYRKGYKFSTYAIWWIREAISRAISEKSKTIYLPANTYKLVNRIELFSRRWGLQYGSQPTVEEIAEGLKYPVEKIEFALECAANPISLDIQVGAEDGTTIGEYIEDTKSDDPFNRLSLDNLREHIGIVLDFLDQNERDTVIMRFGLDDGKIKTLREIGAKLKLTNEGVRQIEAQALRKLKESSMAQELEPWREDLGSITEAEY